MQIAVRAAQLSRSFGAIAAVEALELEIRRGEIFALLGHNGAGKTTTVRMLNGVLQPTSGRAEVLGMDPSVRGPEVRARTGVLTEGPALDGRLTAREVLIHHGRLYGLEDLKARADRWLERLGLAPRARDRVGGFSRGMKQALALCRALVTEPELLFLDEPSSGLDPVAARRIHALIRELAREGQRTVVLCTHNLIEAERICDRVAVMERGRVLALGAPSELVSRLQGAGELELEFGPSDARAALARLGDPTRPGGPVDAQDLGGGRILLRGVDRTSTPALIRELSELGLYRAEPRRPGLEAVYFALHGASGGDGAATTAP